MRILIVNVNTSTAITRALAEQARTVARAGTEIEALTPRFGPASVEGNFESHLAAVAVMDRVMTYDRPYDAVIQAGFGDHGKEGLQELCPTPVIDITEAAAHTACLLGHRYSVVTSLDRTVPMIRDRLTLAGLHTRCASVRASGLGVLELESDPTAAAEAVARQARLAVEQDGAEVVVLGCGGMAGMELTPEDTAGAPVVDGLTSAVALAESLVGLGLTTSKVRTFAAPRPKPVTHWPLSPGLEARSPRRAPATTETRP